MDMIIKKFMKPLQKNNYKTFESNKKYKLANISRKN